jgi:Ran GTPase-activating protein (RanGAP) involved in mRNA processing and transport
MQNNSEPEEITKLQDLDINEEETDEEENYEYEDKEDILRKIKELSTQENKTCLDLGSYESPRVLDILIKESEADEESSDLLGLTELNLENNRLDGQYLIKISELLELFPKIVSLNLDHNDFSNVCKCSASITDSRVTNDDSSVSEDQTLNIKNLSIYSCYINIIRQNSYNIIGFLKRFPKIACLNLGDNGLDDRWMERLGPVLYQCPGLTELNLSSNKIGPEGAKILADVLGRNCNIISLDIFGNNIRAEGSAYIAQVLTQCPNLAELILSMNNIGDEGVLHIANVLVQSSHDTLDTLYGYVQCPKLAVLDLSSNNIGVEGALHIAKALCNGHCPCLTALNLSYNNIRYEGASKIAEALYNGQCSCLTALDLGHNNISDEEAKSLKKLLVL